MTIVMTVPGILKPSKYAPVDGSSMQNLVQPVRLPLPPKHRITHLIFSGGPMTHVLTYAGVIEPSKHAPIDSLSTRSPVQPVHPSPLPSLHKTQIHLPDFFGWVHDHCLDVSGGY